MGIFHVFIYLYEKRCCLYDRLGSVLIWVNRGEIHPPTPNHYGTKIMQVLGGKKMTRILPKYRIPDPNTAAKVIQYMYTVNSVKCT